MSDTRGAARARRKAHRGSTNRSGAGRAWVALTGTPGTGKSSTVRELREHRFSIEVADLALQLHAGRRLAEGAVEVDLRLLRRRFPAYASTRPRGLLVGHLAQFLPVGRIIVLRCHPNVIATRLAKAGRPRASIEANRIAEALDVVLVEALATGLPVDEIDTTERTPAETARLVTRLLARASARRYGKVRWLADATLTEELWRGTT